FNKDDKKEQHREHLERLGIPYVISSEPAGKSTGIVHTSTCEIIGIPKKGTSIGKAIFKPGILNPGTSQQEIYDGQIRVVSQSQNALSIIWDEEYLLATALMKFDPKTEQETEFFRRRLLPKDIAFKLTLALLNSIREKYNAVKEIKEYQFTLDDGSWIPEKLLTVYASRPVSSTYQITIEKEWPILSREEKNDLLTTTLFMAIDLNDPSSFTDYTSLSIETSYITRILKLNLEKDLKLNFNSCEMYGKTALMFAARKNLLKVVNQLLEYKGIEINIQ